MLLFFLTSSALASPADFYGFGGASIGQAGGGVASVSDTSATFLNPAGLSNMERPEILWGASVVRFQMADVPSFYWDVNRDGRVDQSDAPLSVDATPDAADGMMMAFSAPILDRFHIGAGLFLPFAHLTRFHTFEPSLPNYFMLENRLNRYAMGFAGSVELPKGLSIGAGARFLVRAPLALHFTLSSQVSAESATDGQEDFVDAEIDVHSIDLRIEADMVPTLGLQWDLGEMHAALEGFRLGVAARGEASMDIDVLMDGQINFGLVDAGELEDTTLALVYQSQVHVLDHYLPTQIQSGLAYRPTPSLDLYVDAQFTQWSSMELNIAQIEEAILNATLADLSTSDVRDGNAINVSFQDTASIKAGVSLRFPNWELGGLLGDMQLIPRGGVAYEPSPLVSQSSESALLNADRLVFALGLGGIHRLFAFGSERRLDWDSYFQYHTLATGSLARESSTEPKAGQPREGNTIPIGGRILVAGFQARYQY